MNLNIFFCANRKELAAATQIAMHNPQVGYALVLADLLGASRLLQTRFWLLGFVPFRGSRPESATVKAC